MSHLLKSNLLHALLTLYAKYFSPVAHATGSLSVSCEYWAFRATALGICIATTKQCDWMSCTVSVLAHVLLRGFHPVLPGFPSNVRRQEPIQGSARQCTIPYRLVCGLHISAHCTLFLRQYLGYHSCFWFQSLVRCFSWGRCLALWIRFLDWKFLRLPLYSVYSHTTIPHIPQDNNLQIVGNRVVQIGKVMWLSGGTPVPLVCKWS